MNTPGEHDADPSTAISSGSVTDSDSTIRPARDQRNPRWLTIFLCATLALIIGIVVMMISMLASLHG